MILRRGEVWVARLNPNQGGEVGKVRPVVVIQADPLTAAGLATVLVVPLTTQRRWGAEALRVPIQPRAIDRSRLGEGPLTRLDDVEIAALEQALRGVMGLG